MGILVELASPEQFIPLPAEMAMPGAAPRRMKM